VARSISGRRSVQAWTGVAVSLGNAAAVLLPEAGPVRLPLCLAFACLGPGCALLCHIRSDAVTAWALAIGLSLAVVTLTSAILAWTARWAPAAGSAGLAALCVASCLVAVVRTRAVVVR
jgi:hypothetical protein